MPSVAVKLQSFIFKFNLKHQLQSRIQASPDEADPSGITSRPEEAVAAANPTFSDGVATKDIHVDDPLAPLSLRLFLPETVVSGSDSKSGVRVHVDESYGGYSPPAGRGRRRLPVMLQFHGGGFVSGSNNSVANDVFCRRIAKLCDVVVVAVGYRLAPENRYPAAFEDGVGALYWVGKQANLAEWSRSRWKVGKDIVNNSFGASMVEPWLAAHGDPSRCVLLGVSCGANIADYVARKSVEAGKLLDPVKVVAQVLMYPFFIGSVPTKSEIKLANSYFYDKAMCLLAWKLFLPEEEVNLDHPAANPLLPGRGPPLKLMPPTLTIVAEHDWMRDRAIAYSEELRKVNVDAPLLDYKDAVHEFATLDVLLKTPLAQACAEDIAIWVKKINLLAESMGVLHCMYFDTTEEDQMAHDLYLPIEFHNGEITNEESALNLSSSAMAGCPLPYLPTTMDASSTWFILYSDAARNQKRLKQGLGADQSIRSYSHGSLYDGGCNGRTSSMNNSLLGFQFEDHTWGNAQRHLSVEAMEEDAAAMLGDGVNEVLKEGSDDGMKLVHQLITCAKVVAFQDKSHASVLLSELRVNALVFGTSFQRVASCFVQGLSDRLALIQPLGVGACTEKTMAASATSEKEEAFRLFYETCPQIQFGHFVANASILEAFEGESSVHVLDLGMNVGSSQGQQWRSLMHSLANRASQPPSSLQITGVGTASECLKDIIDELELYAKSLGMNFQFSMVEKNIETLQPEDINLLEGEALVVNSILQLHCVVKESRGALNSVLQKIRELSPKAVVLVEQDASHNGPFFLGRFMEALHYYSAIFDSLDAMLPKYDTRRAKMEQFYFAEEIKNIISCEGSARVERHQRLDQWRRRMSRAGFQPAPMKMITEAKQWLQKVKPCEGYTIVEEKGCLVLGWNSKPIIAASCWKCS